MIESIFNSLYTALTQNFGIALLAAFGWGILSILLSPCHLSSIPLVIGFIMQQEKKTTGRAFTLALSFSVGILVSIALIGIITASLGRLLGDLGKIGNISVAVIFFIVGLYMMDIIPLNWSIGKSHTKLQGIPAALVLGLVFGIALGPCTFAFLAPILGIVFSSAQSNLTLSVSILSAFAIGHCSIIVFFGTVAGKVQSYLNWTNDSKGFKWIKRICGVLVILGGIYLLYQ